MRIIKKIAYFIYMLMMLAAGVLLIAASLNLLSPETCIEAMESVSAVYGYRIAAGIIGFIFILIGVITTYRASKRLQKSRIVAFHNPDGEVTVSLSAIEEYIVKMSKGVPGIKDVRSRVDINRKGINVLTDISIAAGENIPEITEKIQMEVRNKIQSMLGVEENVNVKMHIRKFMRQMGHDEEVVEEATDESRHVPFRENE